MLFTLTVNGTAAEITALLAPLANNAEAVTNFEFPSGKFDPSETAAFTPPPPSNGKAKAAAPAAPAKPKAEKPKATPAPVIESTGAFDDLPEETVTLDMIRLASKAKLSKQAQIVEILGAHGASNMSTLDPEEYDAVYAKIAAL